MTSGPIVSKETLLKACVSEETVDIAGLGTIRVRSLSRAEFMDVRGRDEAGWDVGVVAYGLVDPALTEDEVRNWRNVAPPRVFDDVAGEVLRVSGLRAVAVGEAKRTFPEEQ